MISAPFPQTATGRALDMLADNVFGVTRISRRPRWWPARWWPSVWLFVESDRSMRHRIAESVGAIMVTAGVEPAWYPAVPEKARKA